MQKIFNLRNSAFIFFCVFLSLNLANAAPIILEVKNKIINVNGKNATVYTIEQPNGTWGYYGVKGQVFDVILKNKTNVPTSIHWHGLILPNNQDGVAGVTQNAIPSQGQYHYHFKLTQAGTFWMHSHMGLQIQDLMEAPFIIHDPQDPYKNAKEVVILFQDFTFKNPETILRDLQHGSMDMSATKNMTGMTKNMDMKNNNQKQDLNDVTYDAFLANYHTLKNPQQVSVKAGDTLRLRFINGAANSNFWVNLGSLSGTAISFDGENIQPIMGSKFQLAIGQRIDILVTIPKNGGVFPMLGQVEGTNQQTGLILKTSQAKIPQLSSNAAETMPALNDQQEFKMKALHPLSKRSIDQIITLDLNGNMKKYIWTINGQAWPKITPINIKPGARVEFIFNNKSNMAHPMHLHGHVFELVQINHQKIQDGPLHDTILVLPHSQVKVVFDALYPGKWMLHCHMAYHQEAGMMTFIDNK